MKQNIKKVMKYRSDAWKNRRVDENTHNTLNSSSEENELKLTRSRFLNDAIEVIVQDL